MTNFEHKIEWTDERISRLWDYYSRTPHYSNLYFSKCFGHHIIRQSQLPINEDLNVLDFGAGPGFIWDHIIRLKSRWHYSALDFSLSSIKKLKEKAAGHPQFRYAHHAHSLPTDLPSNNFDAIFLLEVVEHLEDDHLDATLKETARLMKKGGILIITTPNKEDLCISTKFCPECGATFHEWQHVRSWSVNNLSKHLEQYGFKLCMSKTLDFRDQGFSLETVLRKLVRLTKKIFTELPASPHMIAVYQKY
jgi:SAM-dependent methyltransferase